MSNSHDNYKVGILRTPNPTDKQSLKDIQLSLNTNPPPRPLPTCSPISQSLAGHPAHLLVPASLEYVLVWVWPGQFMSPAILRFQHQASLISAQLLAADDSTSAQEASGQWSLALCLRWGPGDLRPGGLASSLSPQQLPARLTRTVPTLDSAGRLRLGWVLGSCTGTSGVRGHGDQGQAKRLTATHRPRGGGGQRRQLVSSGPAPLAQGRLRASEAGLPTSLPPTHPPISGPADIWVLAPWRTHRRSEGLGEYGPESGGKTPHPQSPSDPGRSGEHWVHELPSLDSRLRLELEELGVALFLEAGVGGGVSSIVGIEQGRGVRYTHSLEGAGGIRVPRQQWSQLSDSTRTCHRA